MPSTISPVRTVDKTPADGARSKLKAPLEYTGSLDIYDYKDLTTVIGREYHGIEIVDLLNASDSDILIRDLAITSKLFCSSKQQDHL